MPALDEIDRKVLDDIARVGWSGISVFPTEDSPGPFFNYTVGLSERGQPDMIVLGMPSKVGHGVLSAAYHAIEEGVTFEPDKLYDQVLEGLQVAILEVLDPLNDDAPMSMCLHLFGEVKGVQIVWPDAQGKFPWDEGFDEKFRDQQPLLGIWGGGP